MSEVTLYACEHPDCKTSGPAESMCSLKGTRTVVCGKHGYEARKRGLRTYRLSDTLLYDKKMADERKARAAAKRKESDAFFTNLTSRNREQGRGVKRADWARA